MTKKSPNPIDIHVGGRVRMRRMLVGMSQDKLGEALGLTFQQVQKYEKGANRIGASRLFQIAKILEVPVEYFYEGIDDVTGEALPGFGESEPTPWMTEFLSSPEGLQLCRYFSSIPDPKVRRRILDLVKSLSPDADSDKKGASGD